MAPRRRRDAATSGGVIAASLALFLQSLSCPSITLLLPLSLPTLATGDAFDDLWGQYAQSMQQQEYEYDVTSARRDRNLDHWDVPTAAAYLGLHPETLKPLPGAAVGSSVGTGADDELCDEYAGHDAAVMFYAQWCTNCHRLAPTWDAVATHLHAGTQESGLVIALFDCEKNARHMELCGAVGIKAYPTIMFAGSGEYRDTDVVSRAILGKDKGAGPMGATELRRTVKFQGNWEYGDMLLDWVRIMKGLSSWHKFSDSGPLRAVRNGLFGFFRKGGRSASSKKKGGKTGAIVSSLPVGVPPGFQSELRGIGSAKNPATATVGGGTGSTAGASTAEVQALERQLTTTKKEKAQYEKAVSHSAHLIEGLLFPQTSTVDTVSPVRDPYGHLTTTEGWYANATFPPTGRNDEHPDILRSCVLELTLDYCQRDSVRITNAYLAELTAIPETDAFPELEEIESTLASRISASEPYCASFESCLLGGFEEEVCRPEKCPFQNEAACSYVATCFDPSIQDEYGIALGLMKEGEHIEDMDWTGATGGASGAAAASGASGAGDAGGKPAVGGWGIPA